MKKEMTRKLGVVLLGVLFISMFLVSVQVVSAAEEDSYSPGAIIDKAKGVVVNWAPFQEWMEGDIGVGFAKILLFVLLALLIYAILGHVPFFSDYTGEGSEGIIGWVVAFIISFLATGFLNLSEVYLIVTSYSSLGFVLSVAIPFAVLFFFSVEIAKSKKTGARVFNKIVWYGFIGFLIYKAAYGYSLNNISGLAVTFYLIAITGIIVYLWVGEKWLLKQLFEADIEGDLSGLRESHQIRLKNDIEDLRRELYRETDVKERKKLQKKIKNREDRLLKAHGY